MSATDTDHLFSSDVPAHFRERTPFTASFTATKDPKKLPGEPQPSILSRLRGAFTPKSGEEREVEDETRALRQRQAAAREVAERWNALTADVEKAKARVSLAAKEFEDLKVRRQAAIESVVDAWGILNHAADIWHPEISVESYYQFIGAMDAALAGYEPARKHLAANLAKAEKALAAFEKEYDLTDE